MYIILCASESRPCFKVQKLNCLRDLSVRLLKNSFLPNMITKLEICNFKSWPGTHTIEFKEFTSIIGPNGSGKSNLLDAISFVLGVTKGLRSTNVKELVTTGLSDCHVILHLTNKTFMRKIQDSTSVYFVDHQKISKQNYNLQLEQMGVLVKAKNFMVFQGDIESIANQSPKDLTLLVEQISGSLQYKQEYEELNQQMVEKTELSHQLFKKKQQIGQEVKIVQRQKQQVVKFDKLKSKRDATRLKYWLLSIYELEKIEEELKMEIELKSDSQVQGQLSELKKELKAKRQDLAQTQKQSIKVEEALKAVQRKEMQMQPEKVELAQEIEFNNNKIQTLTEEINGLKKNNSSQNAEVEKLKLDLQTVNVALASCENELVDNQMQLSKADQAEHTRLNAVFETSKERRLMKDIDREMASHDDSLARFQTELKSKLSSRELLLSRKRELELNIEITKESIKQVAQSLETSSRKLKGLNEERKRITQLDAEKSDLLATVVNRLLEAKSQQQESYRSRKFNETFSNLKRLYPGVKGKVLDICKPAQRKFAIAVGIILGKNMEAIVVDTEKTAMECIEYMRSQRAGTATFIPLDTVVVSHQEKYRGIRGARMALDVLQFESVYERAVKYCVGNTLVADDIEISKQITRETKSQVKVVTLDGTVYHKTGMITGGTGDEVQNRWEQNELEELGRKKDVLQGEIDELRKQKRRLEHDDELRSEVALARSKIEGLEDELEALTERCKGCIKEISFLDQPISEIESEISKVSGC